MIDQQISDRNEVIRELESQNKLANEALNNIAFQLGFQQFSDDEVAIAIESLLATKASNEVEIENLKTQIEGRDAALRGSTTEFKELNQKIEILEDNLDRARSQHLEQLRAIVQMLEPLATHEDKDSLYLSHFGKAAMVYLIQRVVYANIEKLDPHLKPYDNDF